MFPRMTSKSAPVALGTLLALPWKVSFASNAKATGSFASEEYPYSS
ncbi:hypothetical protein QFZ73_004531 [Peribacillus sp. V2I11]|nr:hypothetical protein [Peribacillus sp. V2I11]